MPVEVKVENGKATIKTVTGDTIEMPEQEFMQKHPELAGQYTASRLLDTMDVGKVFARNLNPPKEGPIEFGDRVMVRASAQIGEIVRTVGDALRVQMSDGSVQTMWPIELWKI